MLDGLDNNLRLIHDRSSRELHTAVWASEYAVGQRRAVSLSALTELDSPHPDLVTDYRTRVAGTPCVVLRGPWDSLYAAKFMDLADVRVSYPQTPRWLRTWAMPKLTAKNAAIAGQVDRVNDALRRDGTRAVELQVPLGTCTDGVPNTITVYVAEERLYRRVDAHPEWGGRDELARQCAAMARLTRSS